MTENLTARDAFQQFDVRLSRVETDLRELRSDINGRFDYLIGRVEARFDSADTRTDGIYKILYGVLISIAGMAITVALGVAGLWFKA
ncbi:MAG: hypothetical protein HOM68_10205 [Gemmatimonadetes bacterium]|nr:hypothetical protein [Gemmatimonadota bacterium]MBT5056899.1 hypothetical protein [Gemmatimonadota bacterium]MBT5141264.1 hypothetical protein [Gemmatimonadota bacterium]MBT5590345.1 hypothetical protein [Gemmatimonadota bacterium]MBT5963878.1 hypothetical protein [Gemmatimonadota bacterium]